MIIPTTAAALGCHPPSASEQQTQSLFLIHSILLRRFSSALSKSWNATDSHVGVLSLGSDVFFLDVEH